MNPFKLQKWALGAFKTRSLRGWGPSGSHVYLNSVQQIQGKTPWVDQSCADCPGFPVLGAGDAPRPKLHPGASECAPGLTFAFMALRANSWICCPQLPYHPFKNGTHTTCFCSTGGHTPTDGLWRIGRGVSPDRVRKTRFNPSESSAGHGLPPQRAPKQCPANGVRRIL